MHSGSTKGKEYKRFEVGSKASIPIDQATGIIMGAINFTQRPYLIQSHCRRYWSNTGGNVPSAYPQPDKNITKDKRKKHSKRAAIEPVTGQLKQHYRLCTNYLKAILGDNMNLLLLAAAAMNFKRQMNHWRSAVTNCLLLLLDYFIIAYRHLIAKNLKMTF